MVVDGAGLVELRQVSKHYVTGGVVHPAVEDVDLRIDAGEFVGVVGPSGSGKSTLLNLVAGIDRPTSGTVRVGDVDVSGLGEDAAARWRGRQVGVVFQFFQLLPTLTLAENVMLPMDYCGVHRPRQRPAVAGELLDRVGLAGHTRRLPAEVSGGQQQRAAIARALANDPPLVLADEPTGNLDSVAAASMMDLFAELTAGGRTVVMVTHDRELAARTSRTVAVRDGRVHDGGLEPSERRPGVASTEASG